MSRRSRRQVRRNSRNSRPLFEMLEDRSLMALWVVNTLADIVDPDADVTSLREAIQQANAISGADTIRFNVAGNINVTSALPALTDATGGTTIDGTTAPGFAGSPVVTLVGPGTASGVSGLAIHSASNTVRGLQIGNFNIGIAINSATNARVESNTIAFNGSDGIRVVGVVAGGHLFDRNSLFSNGGLGINLVSATDNALGVTLNDPGDADSGPNGLQNFPVISSAVAQAFGTEVTFSLNSTPNTAFNLQFFASPSADPSGFGEGQVYLGDYPVITNAAGNVSDVKIFSAVPVGHVITATAATPAAHNTSEFSAAVAVTSAVTTRTWTGGGRTANWSDPANWDGTAPVAGDHLVFGPGTRTTSVNDLAAGTSFGSIKFTAGGFVLNGNPLKVGAGIEVTAPAGSTIEVGVDVSIANDLLPYIEQDSLLPYIEQDNVLKLSGMFTGDFDLEKLGRGMLILSAANTYTGQTTVAEGVLRLENSLALGSTALGTELTNGNLELQGGLTIAGETLHIADGTSNIRSIGGNNIWTGTWHIDPICNPIVVEAGSTLTTSGVLSGVGGFHKEGPGAFVLTGANAYAGVTHVEAGTLSIRSNTALGSTAGNTELMGGSLELAGDLTVVGEPLVVQDACAGCTDGWNIRSVSGSNTWTGAWTIDPIDVPIVVETGSQLMTSGVVSGIGGLNKDGLGAFILSGANTYAGRTLVNEGVLSVRSSQALGSTAGDTVLQEGARLDLENVQISGETLTIEPSGGFLQGELRSVSGSNTWTGPIVLPQHIDPICNPIRALPGSVMRLSGVISGGTNAEVAKFGGGTLILSAANTFTGQAKAVEGVLRIENSQALGTGAGNTQLRGGTRLEIAGNLTVREDLSLVGSPPGSQFPAVDILSIGLNKWEGLTAVNPETRFTVQSGTLEMSGVISGNDNLEKLGPGTLILSANNTVTGTLRVFDGTLVVNGSQPQMPIEVHGGTLTGSGQVGPVTVVGETENILILQADPLNPGKQSLLVIGSDDDDQIRFTRAGQTGIEVSVNNVSRGVFHPTSRLEVHGGDGDDDIQLAGNIDLSAWLYGDDGDDRLKGGRGDDVLLGGAGNDRIAGRQGRDLVIGGRGFDRLLGRGDEDILIAGYTSFDNNQAALNSIMAEWTRTNLNYRHRVDHLQTGGGLNGSIVLKASGPNATVFDDAAVDRLSGNADRDWYFAQLTGPGIRDIITDNHGNEDEEDL